MDIVIVDKILNLGISLINWKKQQKITQYEKFVAPMFQDFEKVHEDYIDSFKKYRDLLKKLKSGSKEITIDTILETIKEDSLFTEDLRMKLTHLADVESKSNVSCFILAIYTYLRLADFESEDSLWEMNGVRFDLYHDLIHVKKRIQEWKEPEEKQIDRALETLDENVMRLQRSYNEVVRQYTRLKKDSYSSIL
jgi:hypothetical protein